VEETGHNFANVDITKEPIGVIPTIHYMMGGIPTNLHGQVLMWDGQQNKPVNGLYAVGECSCVSVHGANRLGTNSLLDLLVFGKSAGKHITEFVRGYGEHHPMPADASDYSLSRLNHLQESNNGLYSQDVANKLRTTMQTHAGVFRTQKTLDEGVEKVRAIAQEAANISLQDKSLVWNTARMEALEVENLTEVARATITSAAARHECRGAHVVYDYEHPADHPDFPLGRNDKEWLKHTLWHRDGDRLDYKPVNLKPLTVDTIPPKVRTF